MTLAAEPMYLASKSGKKRRVHLWTGSDTLCRMWSTNGLVRSKFHVVASAGEFRLCAICEAKKRGANFIRGNKSSAPQSSTVQPRTGFYYSDEWRAVRYKALRLHGAACQCCGARGSAKSPLHVDHIKPRSKYPDLELDLDNLQVLCRDCNLGKSNRDETDWRPQAAEVRPS